MREDVAKEAKELRMQGSAGSFKYKGANDTFEIVTDPNVTPHLGSVDLARQRTQ